MLFFFFFGQLIHKQPRTHKHFNGRKKKTSPHFLDFDFLDSFFTGASSSFLFLPETKIMNTTHSTTLDKRILLRLLARAS